MGTLEYDYGDPRPPGYNDFFFNSQKLRYNFVENLKIIIRDYCKKI